LQLSFPHLIVRCIGLSAPILSYCHGLARRFGRAFARGGDRVFRTYFINNRGDKAFVGTWSYLDMTALGRQELWEDSPEGYPQTKPYEWWNWHDEYGDATPSQQWVDKVQAGIAAGQGSARSRPLKNDEVM
jgi:hypothetical protein